MGAWDARSGGGSSEDWFKVTLGDTEFNTGGKDAGNTSWGESSDIATNTNSSSMAALTAFGSMASLGTVPADAEGVDLYWESGAPPSGSGNNGVHVVVGKADTIVGESTEGFFGAGARLNASGALKTQNTARLGTASAHRETITGDPSGRLTVLFVGGKLAVPTAAVKGATTGADGEPSDTQAVSTFTTIYAGLVAENNGGVARVWGDCVLWARWKKKPAAAA